MNKSINKILIEGKCKDLKEAKEMNDDPFSQPKDIEKRLEEQKRKIKEERRKIVSKIKSGLENIRVAYKNKDWDCEQEKLFLQMFSEFHLNKKYNKQYYGYFLLNKNDGIMCAFDLRYKIFYNNYEFIWIIFEKIFHENYQEIKLFMNRMLRKHFKLNEFFSSIL